MYAKKTQSQISLDKGLIKLRTPGVCFFGLYTIILMPSDMKGLENSITRSRSELIVKAEIAMSASCNQNHPQYYGYQLFKEMEISYKLRY